MNKKDFLSKLDDLLELDSGTITGDEVLQDIEEWDSLTLLEFIALVDKEFGVTLSPENIKKAQTVNDLVNLLEDNLE